MSALSFLTRLKGAELALETHGLEKRYGPDAPALGGLDLEIPAGAGRQGEIAWTVWGDEDEVAGRLAAAGATVRESAPLSLEDATLALLRAGRGA